jgi:putative ABC transport system permease protein
VPFDRWLDLIPLRLRALFRGADVDRELDEELRYHVDRQTELNIAQGMRPDAARTAALRAIGGIESRKEELREQRATLVIEHVLRDVRYAVRVLRRSPIFAVAAVGVLALGIGANAAMFALIDTVVLRRLPVPRPDQIAEIRIDGYRHDFGIGDGFNAEITHPLWELIRTHQHAFSGMFAWGNTFFLAGDGADRQGVGGLWVSADYFPVLGVVPERGRLLDVSDDKPGCGAGSVVVSHAFWQRYFGGRDSVVGARLTILDRHFTVVGVAPATFTGLEVGRGFDVALPICSAALFGNALERRDYFWLTVMGRLRPQWTIPLAAEQLRTLSPGLFEATVPSGYSSESTARYRAYRLTVLPASRGVSRLRESYSAALYVLLGLTALVLLITSANLATLMLARAVGREREFTVRVALGASRWRILSQAFIESLIVAALGAICALPVAVLSSRAMVGLLSTARNPVELTVHLDWRVALFTGAAAMVTAIVFGLVPAIRASLVHPAMAVSSTRGLTGDTHRSVAQRFLLVGQVAVSLVLAVAALFFVRSFQNLISADTGFTQDRVMAVNLIDLQAGDLPIEQRVAFQATLTDAIRSIPGVVSASSSTHTPLSGASWWHSFIASIPGGERTGSPWAYVDPGYFNTLQIPLVAGRGITAFDTAASKRVVVVNESFVREHLHGVEPIGTTLRTSAEPGYPELSYEIVGVVRDTTYADVKEGKRSIAFSPLAQDPGLRPWAPVLVRTSGPPSTVMQAIKQRVTGLDAGILIGFTELRVQRAERLVGERMLAWLSGGFGVLAMMIASFGLYGIVAYLAGGRRNEIGIRLSLGSSRLQIIRLVMGDSARLVILGLVIGLPVAIALMRMASALLFGLSATDAGPLAAAVIFLTVAAAVAALIPAWRASRLDPSSALRAE